MTVGAKIQQCRKKARMSQEELGQQLLVSRQTISLWENDQTLPTIDNLIRLREIFGISIDEMLSENENTNTDQSPATHLEEQKNASLERYTVHYDDRQLREIEHRTSFSSLRLLILTLVGFVIGLTAICLLEDFSKLLFGIWIGSFLICVPTHLIRYVKCKRQTDRMIAKMHDLDFVYEVFEDRFVMTSLLDGNEQEIIESKLDEIESGRIDSVFLTLSVKGKAFYFPNGLLRSDSALLAGMPADSERKTPVVARRVSILLCVASLLAFLSVVLIAILSFRFGRPRMEQVITLVASCISLIPIASLIFGGLSRIGKNITVGSITAILIYGMMIVIHMVDWNPVVEVSHRMDLDLPEYSSMIVSEIEDYRDEVFIYYDAEVYFDEETIASWELTLDESDLWKSGAYSDEMRAIYPFDDFYQGADYFLLYDVKSKTYHAVSEQSGYRDYLLIAYLEDENLMRITKCNVLAEE